MHMGFIRLASTSRFAKAVFVGCVCLLLAHFALAQDAGSIRAWVVDETKLPVEFANVMLYTLQDSFKVVSATTTDSLGSFVLQNLPFAAYKLKISMIGFMPIQLNVSLEAANTDIDLQNITLIADSAILNGVEITSHKDLIKKTPQGFIIQAKDNLTQAGGTATDLLKNTPTVIVDPEGGITIRGKAPLILINGRNSNLGSTDRIPASSVESIEIINNPTAQYDADSDGGIINIKLKKNTSDGFNVSIAAGGGFGAKGRANSSLLMSYKKGKWNLGLAYDNRFAGRTRKRIANRTDFDIPDNYYLLQHRFDNRFERTQNLKFNVDFQPNESNSLSFEAIGNYNGEDNDENLTSMFRTQEDIFSSKNARESLEKVRDKVAEFSLLYNRKFDDPRKYLSANVTSSLNSYRENTDISTQSLLENDEPFGSPYLQRTYNYQNSSVSNFRIDYGQPIKKKGLLEMGYKAIARFTDADFQSQYWINREYVKNPLTSNIFNFREQIHAAYLQYSGYIGAEDSVKWKYDIGFRAEQVFNHGAGVSNNVSVTRRYFNPFPTANLSYHFNALDYLKIGFSRRINRPDLGDLNPFIDITDSLNQHGGNPYLKPELVNAAELGYYKEWKNVSFFSNLFYRYATNIIRPFIALNANGVALTQPMNFGNMTTYGIEEIASIFPVKFWNANLSLSFFQQNIGGSNVSENIAKNVFSWYGKIINNFSLWKGSQLQVIGNYNARIGTSQGYRNAIYYADMGFRQKVLKGKGALGIVATDVFNTQRSGYTATANNYTYTRYFKIDTRAIMLTLAYTFGTTFKEEMLENRFENN